MQKENNNITSVVFINQIQKCLRQVLHWGQDLTIEIVYCNAAMRYRRNCKIAIGLDSRGFANFTPPTKCSGALLLLLLNECHEALVMTSRPMDAADVKQLIYKRELRD